MVFFLTRVKIFFGLNQCFSSLFFCDPKSLKQPFAKMTATQINLSERSENVVSTKKKKVFILNLIFISSFSSYIRNDISKRFFTSQILCAQISFFYVQ